MAPFCRPLLARTRGSLFRPANERAPLRAARWPKAALVVRPEPHFQARLRHAGCLSIGRKCLGHRSRRKQRQWRRSRYAAREPSLQAGAVA